LYIFTVSIETHLSKKFIYETPENLQEPQVFAEHDLVLNVVGEVSCCPLCGECASRTLKKHHIGNETETQEMPWKANSTEDKIKVKKPAEKFRQA
jgi:hypothetical protein